MSADPKTKRIARVFRSPDTADRVNAYLRVVGALMLRDMRTRFMGSYLGYVAQVLWPVSHVIIIAGALAIRGLPSPLGDSAMVFVATGAIPALAFQYISREMMKGILGNKPLTYYPQVKALDVMLSRIFVEIIGSFLGVMIIGLFLLALGLDPIPPDILTAIGGYVCAIMFGISIGTINVAIVQFFPGWVLGFVLLSICLYISSGIPFVPSSFPEQIYVIMKWNPLLQIVEWVRLGYHPEMEVKIDYIYLFLWITISLSLGLLLERTISRRGV